MDGSLSAAVFGDSIDAPIEPYGGEAAKALCLQSLRDLSF
jgi:hypothetical protein